LIGISSTHYILHSNYYLLTMTFHTTGIVLRIEHRGENDRVAHVYTDTHGKLELFVKSGRRMASKLSPHLEELTIAECYVVRGHLDHLAGIERVVRHDLLHTSLFHMGNAAWAVELVMLLTRPDHPDRRIFDALTAWFAFLEKMPSTILPERLRLAFLMPILDFLGYRPEFEKCVLCAASQSAQWFFSGNDGGLVCGACKQKARGGLIVCDARAVGALQTMGDQPVAFDHDAYRELNDPLARSLTDALLMNHLSRPLESLRFLAYV